MPKVTINTLDGKSFGGYVSLPNSNQAPGLLLIHDFEGVSAFCKSLCDFFAKDGYLTICPYLFNEHNKKESFNSWVGCRDLLATVAYLRGAHSCNGKIGAFGFGIGGDLAWFLAARSDVSCAVCYNPKNLGELFKEAEDICIPFLLLLQETKDLSDAVSQKIPDLLKKKKNFYIETLVQNHSSLSTDNGFFSLEKMPNFLEYSLVSAFLKENLTQG